MDKNSKQQRRENNQVDIRAKENSFENNQSVIETATAVAIILRGLTSSFVLMLLVLLTQYTQTKRVDEKENRLKITRFSNNSMTFWHKQRPLGRLVRSPNQYLLTVTVNLDIGANTCYETEKTSSQKRMLFFVCKINVQFIISEKRKKKEYTLQ